MPVKSWVTSPASGAVVSGSVEVEGVAFSGAGRVNKVEVTVMVEGLGKLQCSAPTPARLRGAPSAPRSICPVGSSPPELTIPPATQPARSDPDVNGYSANRWLDHAVSVSTA